MTIYSEHVTKHYISKEPKILTCRDVERNFGPGDKQHSQDHCWIRLIRWQDMKEQLFELLLSTWASTRGEQALPPGNWDREPKISRKPVVSSLIPINWFDSCNGILFANTVMVSCTDERAFHSCPLICPQRQDAKLVSGLFYWRSVLGNNNMGTNLQSFTSSYSRPFAACECWTQTSWQIMQRWSYCWYRQALA